MATTAELTTVISTRIKRKVLSELVWADITQSVGQLSQNDKDNIVAAAKTNDAAEIGNIVLRGVQAWAQGESDSEAAAMMIDNTLDFTELDRILG